jgi:putative transposase
MVEPANPDLSIGKQCKLLSISRSSFSYTPKGETAMNLILMRQIDEQFLETPFFGVRQMTWHTRKVLAWRIHRAYAAPLARRSLFISTTSSWNGAGGKWSAFYNRKRPHSALGGRPPPSRGLLAEKRKKPTRSAGAESSLIYTKFCPRDGE